MHSMYNMVEDDTMKYYIIQYDSHYTYVHISLTLTLTVYIYIYMYIYLFI